jgi:hypothetical protein
VLQQLSGFWKRAFHPDDGSPDARHSYAYLTAKYRERALAAEERLAALEGDDGDNN